MMTLEDRYLETLNDPKKRAKAFKIVAIVSYSMLMLGAAIILWLLYTK
jgi:hypothetical protein